MNLLNVEAFAYSMRNSNAVNSEKFKWIIIGSGMASRKHVAIIAFRPGPIRIANVRA